LDDTPALRVAVTSVSESRNPKGRGTLVVNLSIAGEGLPPRAVVDQIALTKAADNLGNVLGSRPVRANPGAPSSLSRLMMMANLANGRNGTAFLIGEVFLDSPERKAESLKYIEGSIVLFLPSESNGSIVRIPNIVRHAGRIEAPALAKHDIEFHFFPDQANWDKAKNLPDFGAREKPPTFPTDVGYSFRDPSGRLAYFELQDANGAVIPMNGTSWGGGDPSRTGAIHLQAPLPRDAQLVFFLTIPEAIKTVPFRVEDIALP
jgi:hypothetical protein